MSPPRQKLLFVGDVGLPSAGSGRALQLRAVDALTHTASLNQMHGLQLLRAAAAAVDPDPAVAAANAEPLLGAHPALRPVHLATVDAALRATGHSGQPVRLVKAAHNGGTSPFGVLLLSTGVMVQTSSTGAAADHGVVLPLSGGGGGGASAAGFVQDVAAGETHFACCTDRGEVFTFGWGNEFGQLGDGTVWPPDPRAATDPASLILTEPKRLRGFGIADEPATGNKSSSSSDQPPPSTACIIAVACGRHHTVLLAASKACVYAFGRGHRGQCGHRVVPLMPTPRSIGAAFGARIAAIAAADDHTMLLLESGRLFSLGANHCGQLGTGGVADVHGEPLPAVFAGESADGAAGASQSKKGVARPLDDKARASIRAPHGSVESMLYPRRVARLAETLPAGAPKLLAVTTSATHTVATAEEDDDSYGDEVPIFSCGLHAMPAADDAGRRIDAAGALCRRVATKAEARRLARVALAPPSTRRAGWLAACGAGFVAFVDPAAGVLRVHGRISEPSGDAAFVVDSAAARADDGYERPHDDSVLVDVGPNRRVVAACPAKNGLFVLVETTM